MKLVTYEYENVQAVGVLHPDGSRIAPVRNMGCDFADMNDLIRRITPAQKQMLARKAGQHYTVPAAEAGILSPIPHPTHDVICLGLNYTEHMEEAAAFASASFVKKDKRYAVYFSKRVGTSPGPEGIIPAYTGLVDSLDYEVELAVIIGRDAFQVSREQALDCIFGYTILNDVSARNLQSAHTQWYFGKSLDGFTPMGPVIVTADEISFPPRLGIRSRVNGELMQDSTTDMLITGIDEIISELSRGMTLEAGTIIATGTPKGVGLGFDPPRWLQPGDTVECEIDQIGVLRNYVGMKKT